MADTDIETDTERLRRQVIFTALRRHGGLVHRPGLTGGRVSEDQVERYTARVLDIVAGLSLDEGAALAGMAWVGSDCATHGVCCQRSHWCGCEDTLLLYGDDTPDS